MARLIDLTHTLHRHVPGVRLKPARRLETDGWNATTLELYSHCGTHMDAPVHFGVGTQTIDALPLDRCLSRAWLANLTPVTPRQLLTSDDLGPVRDHLQPGEGLLVRTDWHQKWGQPEFRDELPRVSEELAAWLVERQVGLLGVEPPSVADVNDLVELTRIHQILFAGDVILVEGLAHLDQIRQPSVRLIALPLKIQHGDGCPVRAIAVEGEFD